MYLLKNSLLVILLISFSATFSQRYYIENYTPKEFGKENTAQNWSITQDSRGILYFGNNLKIIQYTGENWSNINTAAGGSYVTSMLYDTTGIIYVGAVGEFGYVKPDISGNYEYVSLSEQLPEKENLFSRIFKTLKYKDGVLFFSQENIFFLKNDSISIIKPKTTFHNIFVIDDILYARQREIGLMQLKNNKFELVANGDLFKDYGVFGMFKNNESNEITIVTQEIGLFKLTNGTINKIETTHEGFLNKSLIFGGTLLHDNNIALNTAMQGVIIIDFNGDIKNIINTESGLIDNDIKQVFQDKDNKLWLAMNTGIASVNYSSAVSYFNSNSGIDGRIKAICSYNNTIFVGTSTGLFFEDKYSIIKQFHKYPGYNESVNSLNIADNNLIIGSKNVLLRLESEKIELIDRVDASAIYYSDSSKLLYVVGTNGLIIYKKQANNWNIIAKDDWLSISNPLSVVIDNNYKKEGTSLWVGTLNQGVVNYTIDNNLNINFEQYRGLADGLDDSWARPVGYNNSFLVATTAGLMSFTDGEALKQIIGDTSNAEMKGYFDFSGIYSDTSTYTCFTDNYNSLWTCIHGSINVINKADKSVINTPFKSIDLGNFKVIYPQSENKLWIGGDNGIALVNLNSDKNYKSIPSINITKVISSNDSVIFSGNFIDTENQNIVAEQEEQSILELEFKLNSLNISFASINNEDGKKALYSYKLEGYDNNWSEWSRDNTANYKKIKDGTYTFSVKAKDIYGNQSKIAKYSFIITPPFYKTIWAYLVYSLLLALLIFAIVKISIRRLKAQNEELERIVKERTKEISEQRDELAEQKKEIEDSINYAKRIQEAVLPHNEYIEEIMNDYFILFKPKDVVSGDFYWTIKIDNKIIITAADCTGHGVPGAFMSMLGVSFLNQIIRVEKNLTANKILNILRKNVIFALKQKGLIAEQKDGMDMSLCIIDTVTNKIEFAGANNPLYIVTKQNSIDIKDDSCIKLNEGLLPEDNGFNLFEVKADKMPIAIYAKMDEFENKEIQLQKGDCIYMFSDGYADQFGGPKGKKFKYKPFKRLILGNSQMPMHEQSAILEKEFTDWHNGFEQIDDVVIVGIRI